MDALFAVPVHKLDASRFEIRKTASGAEVIVAKGEKWVAEEAPPAAAAPAAAPAGVPGVAEMAVAFAKMAVTATTAGAGPAAPAVPPKTYKVSELSLEERFESVRLVGEECIQASAGCTRAQGLPRAVGGRPWATRRINAAGFGRCDIDGI
jgi:hypothetical protein